MTWFRVNPPGLAFDTGRGAPPLTGAQDVFLSHGHLDHSLGVPYVLSQRSLHTTGTTRVFCPAPIAEAVGALIAAAERLDRATYRYELVALAVGDRVLVGKDLTVEAFATDHVVPSLGYHLLRSKRRLAPEHAGRSEAEIVELRRAGVDVTQVVEERWLSYCGDTSPRLFELSPEVFSSRVLMIECTFLATQEAAKRDLYKHLDLADLERVAERFENEAIVLHHLSRRHRVEELRAEVRRRLPSLAPRIRFLVEPEMESERMEVAG